VPGIGTLSLANLSSKIGIGETYLKWALILGGTAAVIFFGFPYIAPQLGTNFLAAKALKKTLK
jgi:hypothetical protein